MSEFSRLIAVASGMKPGTLAAALEVEAGPDERAALALRFGLISLNHLSARGQLQLFDNGQAARLDARIIADVVQACVVTLEPVASHIEENLSVHYAQSETTDVVVRDVQVQFDDDEEPEPITDDGIDIGEAVAECLGLALDPYPRAVDADSALESLGNVLGERDRRLPFAVLGKLKRK